MTAVLLACLAGAAFGALAVAVRVGLARGGDPALAPLGISLVACVLTSALAAATGELSGLDLGAIWPFAAIGAAVPGLSQILFVRAIREAGPSRASIMIGSAPLLSAVLAVAFLDESLGAALAAGTVLVVVGGAVLAWERARPAGFRFVGLIIALVCALLFAGRDNLVRAAARSDEVPPLAAASASLLGAACILLVVQAFVPGRRLRRPSPATVAPFLPAAVCLGLAYAALVEALDRGTVTVVAPLNATQSLWAVAFSALALRRSEAIGGRLVGAAALVVAGSAIVAAAR